METYHGRMALLFQSNHRSAQVFAFHVVMRPPNDKLPGMIERGLLFIIIVIIAIINFPGESNEKNRASDWTAEDFITLAHPRNVRMGWDEGSQRHL